MQCSDDYFVGDKPYLSATFTNPSSTPANQLEDPSALVVTVKFSDGTSTDYTYSPSSGPIKRASTGVYYAETIAMSVAGKVVVWWVATMGGGSQASQYIELLVKRK